MTAGEVTAGAKPFGQRKFESQSRRLHRQVEHAVEKLPTHKGPVSTDATCKP